MGTSLARWQFATTSIYHFLFVPVTIGLAFLVAILETAAYRSGDQTYRRLTRFFGVLLLINVAVGVVTGLVQEFEFGIELVGLFGLRGQHLRGPSGHGGPGRLLPRGDVPRGLALRLGPVATTGPPGLHLGSGGRRHALGRFHHGRQFPGCNTQSGTC